MSVTLNPGVAGPVIHTDVATLSGVVTQIPVSKLMLGAAGVDGGLVGSDAPLPVSSLLRSDKVVVAGTPCDVKTIFFNFTTNTVHTLIAAVGSRKLRVLYMWLQSTGSVMVTLTNLTTTGTAVAGDFNLVSNVRQEFSFCQFGVIDDTIAGEGLRALMATTQTLAGFICYAEVP